MALSIGPLSIGIDIGTSGARAVAMRAGLFDCRAFRRSTRQIWPERPRPVRVVVQRSARRWRNCFAGVDRAAVRSIAVDGTSGTMLPVDGAGRPLAEPLMYNDPVDDAAILAAIARDGAGGERRARADVRPRQGAALPATCPASRRCSIRPTGSPGQFSGRFDVSDENNALKTGYDPVARRWPDWIAATGMRMELLPEVVEPGDAGRAGSPPSAADLFGLPRDVVVVAGTTDGCASFLATGAATVGDGVTALGSSLT